MQVFVTGNDPSGRSAVRRIVDVDATGLTGIWPPPDGGSTTFPTGAPIDIGLRPGESRCFTVYFPPGAGVPANSTRQPSMHWTRSTDFDSVLVGSISLILEAESVVLEVGDLAVIPGIKHDWRAGPLGCLMLVVAVGAE
ncbi:MAG: hypothetical protein WCK21_05445 [Actinomycetota bacterium]